MFLNPNEIVKDIKLKEIPDIELYVDQVLTLLNVYALDEDKFLTKAMINNYSKAKIIGKIKGRKYSKAHIIIIAIINRLKQTLTLNEIKYLMDRMEEEIMGKDEEYVLPCLEKIYSTYLHIFNLGYNDINKMSNLLSEAKKSNSINEYKLIEALCCSALSQSYQEKVKKIILNDLMQ